MLEEAGIQFFGPDNVAIMKVRLIVISTSSILGLLFIQDSGTFAALFHPDTINKQVTFQTYFFIPKELFKPHVLKILTKILMAVPYIYISVLTLGLSAAGN